MKFSTDNELILMNQRILPYDETFGTGRYRLRNRCNIKFPHELDPYTHVIKYEKTNSNDKVLNVFITNLPNGLSYTWNQDEITISGTIKPLNEQIFKEFEISNRKQLDYAGFNWNQNGRMVNDNYLFKIQIYVHYETYDYGTERSSNYKRYFIDEPYESPFKIKTSSNSFKPLEQNFDRTNNDIIYSNPEYDLLIKAYEGKQFEKSMKEVKYNIHTINMKNSNIIYNNFDNCSFDFDIKSHESYVWYYKKKFNHEIPYIASFKPEGKIDSPKWKKFYYRWFQPDGWLTDEELLEHYRPNPCGVYCRRHPIIPMIDLDEIYNEQCGVFLCAMRTFHDSYFQPPEGYSGRSYPWNYWEYRHHKDYVVFRKTFILPVIKDFDLDGYINWQDYNSEPLDPYVNSDEYISSRDSFKYRPIN